MPAVVVEQLAPARAVIIRSKRRKSESVDLVQTLGHTNTDMRISLVVAIIAGLLSTTLSARQQQELTPAFEVASVKPKGKFPVGGAVVGVESFPGGRLVGTNAFPFLLVQQAYNIFPTQLSNAPEWFFNTMYDVEAKPAPGAIPPGRLNRESTRKVRLMLQQLLADRFKLKLHTEKKELSIYALLVDKNGLKLQRAPDRDCDATPSPCRWGGGGPASGFSGQSVTLESLG